MSHGKSSQVLSNGGHEAAPLVVLAKLARSLHRLRIHPHPQCAVHLVHALPFATTAVASNSLQVSDCLTTLLLAPVLSIATEHPQKAKSKRQKCTLQLTWHGSTLTSCDDNPQSGAF